MGGDLKARKPTYHIFDMRQRVNSHFETNKKICLKKNFFCITSSLKGGKKEGIFCLEAEHGFKHAHVQIHRR